METEFKVVFIKNGESLKLDRGMEIVDKLWRTQDSELGVMLILRTPLEKPPAEQPAEVTPSVVTWGTA